MFRPILPEPRTLPFLHVVYICHGVCTDSSLTVQAQMPDHGYPRLRVQASTADGQVSGLTMRLVQKAVLYRGSGSPCRPFCALNGMLALCICAVVMQGPESRLNAQNNSFADEKRALRMTITNNSRGSPEFEAAQSKALMSVQGWRLTWTHPCRPAPTSVGMSRLTAGYGYFCTPSRLPLGTDKSHGYNCNALLAIPSILQFPTQCVFLSVAAACAAPRLHHVCSTPYGIATCPRRRDPACFILVQSGSTHSTILYTPCGTVFSV